MPKASGYPPLTPLTGAERFLATAADGSTVNVDPDDLGSYLGIGDQLDVLKNGGNVSPAGNSNNFDHGLGLTKQFTVIEPDTAVAWMAKYVEGPVIWFDDADKYFHMVFVGYTNADSSTMVGSVGHATALAPAGPWTVAASPLFQASGTVGSPDRYGVTGPYMVKENSTYYLFYIGLTSVGYEGGSPTLCLATATSLSGPWTRHGTLIGASGSGWRSTSIWHVSIVKRENTYYAFFNATGNGAKERIGYATATSLLGPWTVDDVNSPLIDVGVNGTWDDVVAGDPSVYRDGDTWWMDYYGFDGGAAGDGIAYTSDDDFPLGWTKHAANPLLTTSLQYYDETYAHKPFVYFHGGLKYHFYTAVGYLSATLAAGTRSIALATSARPSDFRQHYDMAGGSSGKPFRRYVTPDAAGTDYQVIDEYLSSAGPVAQLIYDGAGKRLIWRRTADHSQTLVDVDVVSQSTPVLGFNVISTDLGGTLTVVAGTDKQVQYLDHSIAADRQITLSTSHAIDGSKFRMVRTANATGSFNWNIYDAGSSSIRKALTAGTWAEAEYSVQFAVWVVTSYGSL